MTDGQLVEKCLSGEMSAFNTLVWRWEKKVYNFVLRYIGNREEAKDICQMAFIRAYRNLKSLRDPDKFSTWIYQIVLNVCRDEIKKRSRRKTFSLNFTNGDSTEETYEHLLMEKTPFIDPETAAQNQNVHSLLNKALQSIPEEQRVVVVMKQYQGLKFTEIAESLDISVNTAKSRMYYGLSALKKIFDEWNIDREKISYEM